MSASPTSRIVKLVTVVALSVGSASFFLAPRTACADEKEAIAKVTDLNKQAIAAYEQLELDDARNLLMQALQICASEGLSDHPVKARTHLHLGVILAGGYQDGERAVVQFQKALETQPSITITGSLANPEIDKYFKQAQAKMPAQPKEPVEPKQTEQPPPPDTTVQDPGPDAVETPASDAAPPEGITGIFHEPLSNAPKGERIEIRAAVEKSLDAKRLILAYKPDGAGGFLAREMDKEDSGWWTARIPEPATQGKLIHYYIEARDITGLALANNGSASDAHVIALGSAAAAVDESMLIANDDEVPSTLAQPGQQKWFFNLGFGMGFGYASGGVPELTRSPADDADATIEFSGAAPSGFVISPEVGYFLSSNLILSVQLRLEMLPGLTSAKDTDQDPDVLLSPASGGVAGLVKGTWLLGTDKLRPYVSLAVGAGQLRYAVDIGAENSTCGDSPDEDVLGEEACIDSVMPGPFLIGPGAGVIYMFTDMMGAQASISMLLGLPDFAANADFGVGLVMTL